MKILVLDDEPYRHQIFREHLNIEGVRYTWTSAEAVRALQSERFDLVLLEGSGNCWDVGRHTSTFRPG